ncbi:endonuclease/exonuclease/phosphatase family protein [Jannaschia ovalis]|uniref:Endonuclease/exonuclease/phosphatase family protein n=1 Tax=Jannaschia ovalis TaxID=3038773 RepID=A0ABY8LJ86_9RHOB|nr:endonuclease/exonuclease/phosphatase family protein [Jannaschia sp. GRR-S6-38]WGH80225.1 endonuclease/exonuclease/phosphatase family protein [Jannaschia sp. GRR-S6-38]
MLRDLASGRDAQAEAALDVIASAAPEVLLLLDIDWDLGGAGLAALRDRLAEHGLDYPHAVALRPNSGLPSGIDLDGNGAADEARDALGYGRFTGDSGLALLSMRPLGPPRDLSGVRWSARSAAVAVLPEAAHPVVPLATTAQWVVPMGDVTLVTMAAGTPVFDGPEDRNGKRTADELAFVAELAGGATLPIVLGRANVDPRDGDGPRAAIRALLGHPALQDPAPRGAGGGGAGHAGDPALDTVAWDGPGPLRVDYVLPARALAVRDAGIVWPAPGDPLAETVAAAGSGRLVWVDIALP